MVDHWEKFGPPVYVAVAGYLGLIGREKKSKGSSTEARPATKPIGASSEKGDLKDLARLLSGSGGVLNG